MSIINKTLINEIVEACHEGIFTAQKAYEAISGGEWLFFAPEYYSTSAIFNEIGIIDGVLADLEKNVTEAICDAGARGKGKLKNKLRPNGRCDILVWHPNENGDYFPLVPIEVKCAPFDSSKYTHDIKRLTEMVAKNALNNTIQAGIFTFFISEKQVEKLEKSKLAIFDKIRSMDETDDFEIEIKAKTTIIETGSEEDSGAWCSVTILLYLKEKQ